MTTHEDPTRRGTEQNADPAVHAVEEERGGVTDASLDPQVDTDVDVPDTSITDDAAQVEAHPS